MLCCFPGISLVFSSYLISPPLDNLHHFHHSVIVYLMTSIPEDNSFIGIIICFNIWYLLVSTHPTLPQWFPWMVLIPPYQVLIGKYQVSPHKLVGGGMSRQYHIIVTEWVKCQNQMCCSIPSHMYHTHSGTGPCSPCPDHLVMMRQMLCSQLYITY